MLFALWGAAAAIRGIASLSSIVVEGQRQNAEDARVDWVLALAQAESVLGNPERYTARDVKCAELVMSEHMSARRAQEQRQLQEAEELARKRRKRQATMEADLAERQRRSHEQQLEEIREGVERVAWAQSVLADPTSHPIERMTAQQVLDQYGSSYG